MTGVRGSDVITLRLASWDTSDPILASTVLLDGFTWSVDEALPGTYAE